VAARLLVLWVRIPPTAWTLSVVTCCVLSGRDLCDWDFGNLKNRTFPTLRFDAEDITRIPKFDIQRTVHRDIFLK